MNPVEAIQAEISQDFSLLDGDQEMMVIYLMELGRKLPPLREENRKEENLVKGCQSKVWLASWLENGKILFEADSNTEITKGLASLLVRAFSNQTPDDILQAKISLAQDIGINRFIGTQRSGGFSAMIQRMKLDTLALKNKAHE